MIFLQIIALNIVFMQDFILLCNFIYKKISCFDQNLLVILDDMY